MLHRQATEELEQPGCRPAGCRQVAPVKRLPSPFERGALLGVARASGFFVEDDMGRGRSWWQTVTFSERKGVASGQKGRG